MQTVPPAHADLRRTVGPGTPNLEGYVLRGVDPTGAVDPDGGADTRPKNVAAHDIIKI